MTRARPGRLLGIGVGPGDPELITLKALRLLRSAAVVAYPAPETGESLARKIVAQWLDRGQSEIAIRFPMRPGPPPARVYDEAAQAIAVRLDEGVDVALLCQGDPLFYGSFIGIMTRLAGRFAVEIVPGVSSLTACAAAAAVPLVGGEECLVVIPATLDDETLGRRLAAAEVAAIVKLGRHLPKVQRVLSELGRLQQALCIERAGWPNQQIRPLAAVDKAPYFALVLVRPCDGC